MTFKETISDLQTLASHPELEISYGDLETPHGTNLDHKAVSKQIGIDCSAAVAETTSIESEFSAYWKGKPTDTAPVVLGEFNLRSVLKFGRENELNEVYFEYEYDVWDLRETRVFDYYAYNGGPIYALLPVNEHRLEDNVLVFDERNLYKTDLDFSSYLAALAGSKGFLYWQYLFCENVACEPYHIEPIEQGLAFIEATFPRSDLSDLKNRFLVLKGSQ
jgi:hypothetical protein